MMKKKAFAIIIFMACVVCILCSCHSKKIAGAEACGFEIGVGEILCRTSCGLALGEDNGDFWTFFTPANNCRKATLIEVPKGSWLVRSSEKQPDYLLVPQERGWSIRQIDGEITKTLTASEWYSFRRGFKKICTLGGLRIVREKEPSSE